MSAITILDTLSENNPVISTILIKERSKANIENRVKKALEGYFDGYIVEMAIPWDEPKDFKGDEFQITMDLEVGREEKTIEIFPTEID